MPAFIAAAPAIGAAAGAGKGVSTATILAAAGAGLSAIGAVGQANAARAQADTQAAIMRQQAERERLQAEADESEFRNEQQRQLARRRAILGGSGVDPSTGSPLLASEDFAGEVELQALKIRSGGEVRGTRLEQQASLTRAKGKSDQTAGFFRAGSTLLKGFGNVNFA